MRRKLDFNEIFSQRPSINDLEKMPRSPIVALIEDIRSMHNVGSIFRTSDGVRLEKLYLAGYTAKPPRDEIDKTALGSTETVPWEYVEDSATKIAELKDLGYTIYAVEQTTDSKQHHQTNYKFPCCLIMGNEVNGVPDNLPDLADHTIEIPMLGMKHSLNVSVAYGVVIYNILSKCM